MKDLYKQEEIKFYRHKEMKGVYLLKNNVCGGCADHDFYEATFNIFDAFKSLKYYGDDFLAWLHTFPNQSVPVVMEKEFDFDGYSGTAKKIIRLPVSEFELVTLREVMEAGL